jgi:hypothetical protein
MLLMSDGKYAVLVVLAGVIATIIAFIIAWKLSKLFTPPRYNWSKSAYAVFMMKLSMAGAAAFYAFIGVISLIVAMK